MARILLLSELLILYFLYTFSPTVYNPGFCTGVLVLVAIAILTTGFHIKRYTPDIHHRVFRPAYLFFIAFFIVNFQVFIDLLVGNLSPDHRVFVGSDNINKGVIFSSISFISLLYGYICTNKGYKTYNRIYYFKNSTIKAIAWLSVVLLWLFIKECGLTNLISGNIYKNLGDINLDTTVRSEVILRILFAAEIIMISYKLRNNKTALSAINFVRQFPISFIITYSIYIALRLLSGVRSSVISSLLLIAFAYVFANRSTIRNWIAITTACIMAISLSIIGIARGQIENYSITDKYSVAKEIFSDRMTSISPWTKELANSVFCNQVAIDLAKADPAIFRYGFFQLNYILRFFVPGLILDSAHLIPKEDTSSAIFLTISRYGYDATSGLGTTINADFFLDFGIIGMVFCLFGIGVFLKKIDLTIFANSGMGQLSIMAAAIVIIMSANVVYLPRSALLPALRSAIYTIIFLYILSSKKSSRPC